MKKLLILVGVGSVLWGAYNYYRIQTNILTQTTYKLSKVTLKDRKSDKVTFACIIDVQNNSDYNFELKDYNINIFLNNVRLGSIINPSLNQEFRGGGIISQIAFDFTFNPKEIGIWGTIYQLIQKGTASDVMFIGNISIQKGLLTVPVPINFNYKLKEFM